MAITDSTQFGKMSPFRFWCQKVLPAVYDDSLSYYELLCKVTHWLNELTEVTNTQSDAIKELQETLAEFMAGEFDSYIEEKVDEWFDENEPDIVADIAALQADVGTLDNIIPISAFSVEHTVKDIIDDKGNGTLCGTNYLGSLWYPLPDPTYGEMHCGSIASTGSYEVVISTPFNITTTNMGKVEFISIENNEKRVFADKYAILGHANSIAYYPADDVFVVAPLYDYSNGTESLWSVLLIYDTTFTTFTTVHTDVVISGVAYDYATGKVYCFGIDDKLYEFVDNDLVYMNDCNVRSADNGLHVQDLAVHDGMWYISNTQGNIAYGLIGVDNPQNIFDIMKFDTFQAFTLFGEIDGMNFNEKGSLICTSDMRILSSGWVFNIFEIITPETRHPMFYLYHPTILASSINLTRSSTQLREDLFTLSTFNAANFLSIMIGSVIRFNLTEDYNAPDETITLNGFAKAVINLNGHDLTIDTIRMDSCELVVYGSGTLTIRRFWAPTCEMAKITLQNNVTIRQADANTNPFHSVTRTGAQLSCGSISNPDNIEFNNNLLSNGKVYISASAVVTNS